MELKQQILKFLKEKHTDFTLDGVVYTLPKENLLKIATITMKYWNNMKTIKHVGRPKSFRIGKVINPETRTVTVGFITKDDKEYKYLLNIDTAEMSLDSNTFWLKMSKQVFTKPQNMGKSTSMGMFYPYYGIKPTSNIAGYIAASTSI